MVDDDRTLGARMAETNPADTRTFAEGQEPEVEPAGLEQGTALGRYLFIEKIGEGGMGVVVRAYDPKLHREIALKRLHRDALDSSAEARLLREAQAMAQLSHPNVVTIYDVERTDQGVVMAMEYAEGQTLAEWMKAGPHPWRETMGLFEQAGRGLAAAHAAGLVHRDFKPSNAIVGPDGRVRVMDFGLARADRGSQPQLITEADVEVAVDDGSVASDDPDFEHSNTSSLDEQLTRAGAVMGTPGYMATEQHRGETADARSDQYAFCVSLWEALWGDRPFRGDFRGIVLVKHQGPPTMPRGSKVPRHVYEALRRGLSPQAADRWPSMAALLDALAVDPGRRRRQGLAAAGALVGVGGLGLAAAAAWPEAPPPPCRDAVSQLESVWDDARRAEVQAALHGTALSYADPTAARVSERLDAYADRWVQMHTEACEATAVHKVQSEALLDLRMQCLRRRKLHLGAVVDVLAGADAEVAKTAIEQVMALPPLERCADAEALTAAVPPPEHPQVARAVEQARDALTRATALMQAGRYDDTRAKLAELLERTEAIDYPPVQAEVLLASARLARLQGQYDRAVEQGTRAYQLALRAGADAVATQAAASNMYVIGHQQAKVDVGWAWARSARPLAQRTDPTGLEEAMVLNGMGVLAYHEGDFAEATRTFEQAQAMLERAGIPPDDRIATNLNHLGAVLDEQGRYTEAEPHFRRALEIQTEVFGPQHPRRTSSMDNLALCLQAQGRNEEARDLHQQALELRRQALGPDHPDTALTLNNMGWDYMGMRDPQSAIVHFDQAREIFERALGPGHPRVAMALESLALAHTGLEHYDQAEALHRRALELRREALGPDHPNVALSLSGLGTLAYDRGRYDEAIEQIRTALAIIEAREGADRYLADILTSLGKALVAAGRFAEAQTQLERALALREQGGGIDPAVLATLRLHLARAAHGQDRVQQAVQLARQGRDLLDGHQGEAVTEARAQLDAQLDAWDDTP